LATTSHCHRQGSPITSRLDPYQVEDIESLLLAQEERLEKHRFAYQQNFHVNLSFGPALASLSKYPNRPLATNPRSAQETYPTIINHTIFLTNSPRILGLHLRLPQPILQELSAKFVINLVTLL